MGHFDGDHGGRHDFEHFKTKEDSEENSDEDRRSNSSRFQVILYTQGGGGDYVENEDPGRNFL